MCVAGGAYLRLRLHSDDRRKRYFGRAVCRPRLSERVGRSKDGTVNLPREADDRVRALVARNDTFDRAEAAARSIRPKSFTKAILSRQCDLREDDRRNAHTSKVALRGGYGETLFVRICIASVANQKLHATQSTTTATSSSVIYTESAEKGGAALHHELRPS